MDNLTFTVDGIGAFEAKPRTMGLQIKIAQTYRSEIGGDDADVPEALRTLASIKAHLQHQLAKKPDGWSLDDAPVEDCYSVWSALRSADDTFLRGLAEQRSGKGAET